MLWNSSFETGIPKIDEQHKELFRQAELLLDNSQNNRIPGILNFLGEYVIRHFSYEQVMHSASKYPKAEAHKQLHDSFVQHFKALRQKYETQGDKLMVTMEINKTVMNWLKDHIMQSDRDFANYYKSLKM